MSHISYDKAIHIAKKFAGELAEKYPEKIAAVFVIGSLGGDYYRPGQSDIDTAIVTSCGRSESAEIKKGVKVIQNRYWKEYDVPKGFGAVVFAKEQLHPPYVKEEELILEILRLKTQSKLIYGDYDISRTPMPDKQAIIDDAAAFQAWVDGEKAKNPDFPGWNVPTLINSTLMILKRYLMIAHGIIEFNKFKTISLYIANDPPIVNDEVFSFIETALSDNDIEVSESKLLRMVEWNKELCAEINDLVLYNDKGRVCAK